MEMGRRPHCDHPHRLAATYHYKWNFPQTAHGADGHRAGRTILLCLRRGIELGRGLTRGSASDLCRMSCQSGLPRLCPPDRAALRRLGWLDAGRTPPPTQTPAPQICFLMTRGPTLPYVRIRTLLPSLGLIAFLIAVALHRARRGNPPPAEAGTWVPRDVAG